MDETETYMKIGEIAAFFNVSVKAVRIYEKKGIIKPAKVDTTTGYRYYSVDQVKQINSLLELQSLGFSLNEIKDIMTGKITGEEFMEYLSKKRMAWQESISVAENKIDAITSIAERLKTSHSVKNLQELTDEQRAWLMVKMVCVEDLRGQSLLSEALWL